jgi:2-polyprenyl-3-methyl-5-hydroxy-6-metoxy-1,4-benzoquinol methylase
MHIHFSCVIDDNSLLRLQSLTLFATIKKFIRQPYSLMVHCVGEHPTAYLEQISKLGATLQSTEPFHSDYTARFCNKLQQLNTACLHEAEMVALCDLDIAFTDDIRQALNAKCIQAKYADTSTPPLPIMASLLREAGLGLPESYEQSTFTREPIPPYYCNGGLYLLPGHLLKAIAPAWKKWAGFSLQALPQECKHYSDQTGFMLAMMELQLDFAPLPEEYNYPLHFPRERYASPSKPPHVLHYHDRLDHTGLLLPLGIPTVDVAIKKVNDAVTSMRRDSFSNVTYWDFRYSKHPDIGSGVGSRDEHLTFKRRALYPLVSWFREGSIVDVGCGDLEVMREADALHYTGVDVSAEAIKLCRKKRPDWNFHVGSITHLEKRFELGICLDVLIHMPTSEQYHELVRSLIDYTTNSLVFGAYDEPPRYTSAATFYYEPISETLRKDPRIGTITSLGTYRDVNLILAQRKTRKGSHPTDISLQSLADTLVRSPYPALGREIVDFSRESLGFFTRTASRVLEYPWIIRQIETPEGKNILDFGAGVNPLPLWLARSGANVITIDTHTKRITVNDLPQCDEWGFFDYSQKDKRIQSHNKDIKSLSLTDIDCIYSCSVIEHMRKFSRIAVLRHFSKIMSRNGLLLLTVDITPHTRRLWNYSQGKLVDAPGKHGTLEDLLGELEEVGFVHEDVSLVTSLFGSRTDIAFIRSRLL